MGLLVYIFDALNLAARRLEGLPHGEKRSDGFVTRVTRGLTNRLVPELFSGELLRSFSKPLPDIPQLTLQKSGTKAMGIARGWLTQVSPPTPVVQAFCLSPPSPRACGLRVCPRSSTGQGSPMLTSVLP